MKENIPDFQSIMYPVLDYLTRKSPSSSQEISDYCAEHFKLSVDDLRILLPSGKSSLLKNRVGWAISYLKNAGLISNLKRGVYQITDLGRENVQKAPGYINIAYLNKLPGFAAWRTTDIPVETKKVISSDDSTLLTPEEIIGEAYTKVQRALAFELLDLVKQKTAAQFEKFVLLLLTGMGYGTEKQFEVVGQAGDDGIDGIIYQDRLGIEQIYVQAKRWTDKKVGPNDVRDFIGALTLKGTNKGVFITTSDFTSEAVKTSIKNPQNRIILINGEKLAEFAIQYNVGVQIKESIELKTIDIDFFEEL